MKNRLMHKVGATRALVLLSVGFSVLAVYVISCVCSPVSWSPDSSRIALFVMPGKDDPEILAIFTYYSMTFDFVNCHSRESGNPANWLNSPSNGNNLYSYIQML